MTRLNRLHSLPEVVRRRLFEDDSSLLESGIAGRKENYVVDLRSTPKRFETRVNDDGTVGVVGYATTWDSWYDVAGGAPYGWSETIARGSATKSLTVDRDRVRFLFDHEGMPMADTSSGTVLLSADEVGLLVDVPSLDVQRNVFAAALVSAIERGDVDQMSFAFRAIRQEWNDDYTERRILELQLFDVSAVTYPANEATIIAMREAAAASEARDDGVPLSLALAQVDALRYRS